MSFVKDSLSALRPKATFQLRLDARQSGNTGVPDSYRSFHAIRHCLCSDIVVEQRMAMAMLVRSTDVHWQ